jgi:hypothetical protein
MKIAQSLKDAYKTATGKMILNYGKTFGKLIKDYGTVAEGVQVGDKCNQDCAVNCWTPG